MNTMPLQKLELREAVEPYYNTVWDGTEKLPESDHPGSIVVRQALARIAFKRLRPSQKLNWEKEEDRKSVLAGLHICDVFSSHEQAFLTEQVFKAVGKISKNDFFRTTKDAKPVRIILYNNLVRMLDDTKDAKALLLPDFNTVTDDEN